MRERLALAALLAAASPTALASPGSAILQFSGAVQARTCDILINGEENVTAYTLPTKTVEYMNTTNGGFDFFKFEVKCQKPTELRLTLALAPGAQADGEYLLNMATVNPAENMRLYLTKSNEYLYLGDRPYSWSYKSDTWPTPMFHFAKPVTPKDRPISAGNYETALQYTVEYR